MSSTPDDRIDGLYRRLHHSEGEKVERELRRLELSFRTFDVNRRVLLEPVQWFENTLFNELWGPGKEKEQMRWEFCYEIARHFQNAIAAGQAFLDQCETMVKRRYRKSPFINEFKQEQASRIDSSDVCMFIEELRGAGLHRDSVTPAYERRLSQTGPWVTVPINTDAIRADDRWERDHPGAARYLRKLGSSFDVQQVIGEYFRQLDDFRRWFFARIREVEARALAELSAIESEIEALKRGKSDSQDSGEGSPGKPPNSAQ